jgi:hypothetical protein
MQVLLNFRYVHIATCCRFLGSLMSLLAGELTNLVQGMVVRRSIAMVAYLVRW